MTRRRVPRVQRHSVVFASLPAPAGDPSSWWLIRCVCGKSWAASGSRDEALARTYGLHLAVLRQVDHVKVIA